ncbi:hypothetical protein [Bacillus weihaiensis]|uniref:Uncharacterized protein n=1 Tax=Bacillus weihaiensis TaxID=1547283 RepID=A0A1L3MN62_9BACI|nr:hypothetical protein [Bacillus weihaiensis]APH03790.1 hypothetical protein A9C19_02895 [Bacillus weihaiensis]
MSKKQNETHELFSMLKQLGFTIEHKLNQYIQNSLDHKEVAVMANSTGKVVSQLVKAIHEYVEEMSVQLNFPTKKDVGRLGKLIVQSEDKLDHLEDELHEVIDLLHGLKKTLVEKLPTHCETKHSKKRHEHKTNVSLGCIHEELIKPLEKLEGSIKRRVIKCSKKLLEKKKKNPVFDLKKDLYREVMKPPGQVDFKELNQKLLLLLEEKRKRKK